MPASTVDRVSARSSARLHPPEAPTADLRRERLHRAIAQDPAAVTLVCGPAGCGKTRLLASWAAATTSAGAAVAWLGLEPGDGRPGPLWSGILAALRATGRSDEGSRLGELRAPPREIAPAFVDTVVDELATWRSDVWLVLDDLHVLEDPAVFASLELLLHRQPAWLRLVLSSRTDPPIALPRLRVEGRLRELRADDLAFTVEETARFLQEAGVALPDPSIRSLHARTEGWAAGLRIAAIALAGSDDPEGLIERFSGDDHAVADYLVSEVLTVLPERTREFLLRTSICSQLDVALAQRLAEREDAGEVLEGFARQSLFTTRLGTDRRSYRYHELFRTYLTAELRRTRPAEERDLHVVAADRLAAEQPLHAMTHLVLAGCEDRLMELAGRHGLGAILDGRAGPLAAILDRLDPASREVPLLALLGAVAAMELDDLDAADRWLAGIDVGNVVEGNDRALATFAAAVGLGRARYTPRVAGALQLLETTGLEVGGDRDLELYALHQRGAGRYHVGDYRTAAADLGRAADLARVTGRDAIRVACLSILAGTYLGRSRAAEMRRYAEEAIEVAERRGWARSRLVAHAHIVGACAAYTRGDLEGVEAHATQALASLGRHPEPDVELAARGLEFVLGSFGPQPHEALRAYKVAFRRLVDAQVPPVVWAVAAQPIVRLCLAMGERHFAREYADAVVANCPDPGEHALLRAVLLLDAGKTQAARQALEPIVRGDARCHLATTEVRARLLAGELEHRRGRSVRAHELLLETLDLAAPLGLLRPFCERPCVLELLRAGRGRFAHHEPFVDSLLDAAVAPPSPAADDDGHRLTPTELAVLRDLPSVLSLEEIAEAHAVSINTIKTHLRAVYRKLDVTRRREAVAVGRQRGLL